MEGFKKCNKCKQVKPVSEFHKNKSTKCGLYSQCKECKCKARSKRYYENIDKERELSRKYHSENYDIRKVYNKQWMLDNKEYMKEYRRKKYREDINFHIAHKIRSQVYHAIRNKQKHGNTLDLLGCSIEEFIKYIKKSFTEGMTFEKLIAGEIELDHIKPLAAFTNLDDELQQREACHYTNYQPLWKEDNRSKKDKWSGYIKEHMTTERINFLSNLYKDKSYGYELF